MVEQEWMRFAASGRIDDYLAYSRTQAAKMTTGTKEGKAKESEQKDGTDHCAYRYGVSSDTHRGL